VVNWITSGFVWCRENYNTPSLEAGRTEIMLARRRSKASFSWLLFLSIWLMASCAPTVKKAEEFFTPSVKSEKEMGREFAQEASKKLKLVEDPEIVEYVTRIGSRLVDAAQPMSYKFRFHVVKSPTMNAFAVPGGHIYLYSGLLLKARHAGEIAGVMAHELAHVKHRHMAQMIGKGTLVSLATLAAIILARGEPAAAAGAMGAGAALQLSFTREVEQEADRFGLFYMYQAGYDPHGLLDFFETMVREQRFSMSQVPPYLLTHPLSSERMAQIENLIQFHRLEVKEPRQEKDFHRFQAMLQAEVGSAGQVIPWFKQKTDENPRDALAWHQLGVVYNKFGWTREALSSLVRAVELDPNLASAWADLGMLQARLGRWEEADRCFERALDIDPDHGPFLAMWGEAMVQRGRSQEGVALLQRALEKDPHLIRAHEMLARAKKDLGDEGGFHEEMASFHEKMDQYTEAMKHLRLAKKAYGEKTPKGEEIQRRIEELKSS